MGTGSARRWPRALPVASERGTAPSLGLPSVSRGAARVHPTGTRPGPHTHAPWRAGGGAAFVPWTRPVGDLIRASARLIVKCRCLLKVRTRACTLRAPVRPGGGFDARSTAAPFTAAPRGARCVCHSPVSPRRPSVHARGRSVLGERAEAWKGQVRWSEPHRVGARPRDENPGQARERPAGPRPGAGATVARAFLGSR